MRTWEEVKDQVREVSKDKEIARSLSKTAKVRFEALKVLSNKNQEKFASILAEGYYEIIKEILTALMAVDGYKTTSHEALIAYLKKFYQHFEDYEISFIDELRKLRNKIDYRGFSINPNYIKRNMLEFKHIISKLQDTLQKRLN